MTSDSFADSKEVVTPLRSEDPSYIVGIGASAGGLEAIEAFFDNMPAETGMAFVVVQHLSPDFKSLMSELLARHTKMPIFPVENGIEVRANCVYLIPPRKNMVLREGKLLLTEQDAGRGLNLPIDIFFSSLAEDVPDRAIAIVLSGTGSDGSRGLQRVHESGGLVLVQTASTAGFDGMPNSARATGMVDVVTSPAEMPSRILQFAEQPAEFQRGVEDEDTPQVDEDELLTLFRKFRQKFGVDFNRYRSSTINRRIDRRLQMTRCKTLTEYLVKLEKDPTELDVLYRDLLVEVTQFFRDSQAFKKIQEEVIPRLFSECAADGQLRIWVPACATGEEAYSLAMIAHDYQTRHPEYSGIDLKVFATDVHQTSLETASSGVYSKDSVNSLPADLRAKYFSRSQDLFHITNTIRQLVIFAPHDITSDPPFTKIDLLSCRNALIYLLPEVQQKVIALFHFGLRVGGILFLGPSESLGNAADEFELVDSHWRIFRKSRDVRLSSADNQMYPNPLRHVVRSRPSFVATANRRENQLIPEIHEELLREYVPPSLLLNSAGELVHSFGDARSFLQQPEGRSTLEVLRMVSGELRLALSSAFQQVRANNRTVVLNSVPIIIDDEKLYLRVVVKPYKTEHEQMLLVTLQPDQQKPAIPAAGSEGAETARIDYEPGGHSVERIVALENELQYNKESLQSVVEELETSNEELQATNEELVASNEELQSTNEELHSVNEELHTVNTEHQLKIQELVELTSDMDNLLKSTEIGTIFLDKALRIRKFTPAIAKAFYILPQDVGRPIEHIASNLDVPNLLEKVESVRDTAEPIEVEARNRDSSVYLLRIQPYLNDEKVLSGVVLTCVDVSAIMSSYDEIRRNAETIELTDRDLQEFAYAVSHDLQAPLRHIANHSRLLRERLGDVKDLDSVESFAAINSSIAKLDSMFVGLLQYSRIYSRGQILVPSDLNKLLDAAILNQKSLIEETGAIIDSSQLPTLDVDPEQITTVFQQLIKNAIIYARESPPKIKIDAVKVTKKSSRCWELSISDNGIGIAPQHRDRIFIIFERLEFRSAPGEGMGLPLCKRILQRHGGSIKATDGPDGRGTTIKLQLPLGADEQVEAT